MTDNGVTSRVVRILRQKFFLANFSTLKLSVALLYDPVCHTSILALLLLSLLFCTMYISLCFFLYGVVLFLLLIHLNGFCWLWQPSVPN